MPGIWSCDSQPNQAAPATSVTGRKARHPSKTVLSHRSSYLARLLLHCKYVSFILRAKYSAVSTIYCSHVCGTLLPESHYFVKCLVCLFVRFAFGQGAKTNLLTRFAFSFLLVHRHFLLLFLLCSAADAEITASTEIPSLI